MPDEDEDAVGLEVIRLSVSMVGDIDRVHATVFPNLDLIHDSMIHHRDLLVVEGALLQLDACAEFVLTSAIHHGHFGGKPREEEGFLKGGIPATHHHDFLAAKEKAVTGSTVRHAPPNILGFAGDVQLARVCANGDDHTIGEDFFAIGGNLKRALREVCSGDGIP